MNCCSYDDIIIYYNKCQDQSNHYIKKEFYFSNSFLVKIKSCFLAIRNKIAII